MSEEGAVYSSLLSPIVEVVTKPLKDDISIIGFLGFFVARPHAYSSHKAHMFPKSF